MAIVKMKKISIVALQSDKQNVLNVLTNMGAVEISDSNSDLDENKNVSLIHSDGSEQEVSVLESKISCLKYSIDYVGKLDKTKKGLFPPKRVVSKKEFKSLINESDRCFSACDEIKETEQQLSKLKNDENRIDNMIQTLTPWMLLDVPLENIGGTVSTEGIIGVFPALSDMDRLKQDLDNLNVFFSIVNSDKNSIYVYILYLRSNHEEVQQILKQNVFSSVDLRGMSGTAAEIIKKLEQDKTGIQKKTKEIEQGTVRFLDLKEHFEVLYDHLVTERDKKLAELKFLRTGKAFMLKGWIPAEKSAELDKGLKEISQYIMLDVSDPAEDDEFPVLLKNHKLVQPFELVTELYSLPHPKGIDPNLFMAPFYFIFFGMMVSDAAYGLIIAAVTGFLSFKYKPEGVLGKILRLLCLGGISTFIWGVLYGGWFGDLNIIFKSEYLANLLRPRWFNPLEDPIRVLIISCILGVIHLYTGIGLQAYRNIRDGKLLDALFDQGFWYLFLTGLIFLLVPGMGAIGKYMAWIGAILLILTQGRSEKSIIKKLTSGILSLYNATGFLSDVLSYSRLLALGLATGVIGVVINTMAAIFGWSFIGVILLIIIFTGGHIFNILINVLGAYVHASRLQYVEFFGKFYESGGKAFTPLKNNNKYIYINEGEENL